MRFPKPGFPVSRITSFQFPNPHFLFSFSKMVVGALSSQCLFSDFSGTGLVQKGVSTRSPGCQLQTPLTFKWLQAKTQQGSAWAKVFLSGLVELTMYVFVLSGIRWGTKYNRQGGSNNSLGLRQGGGPYHQILQKPALQSLNP